MHFIDTLLEDAQDVFQSVVNFISDTKPGISSFHPVINPKRSSELSRSRFHFKHLPNCKKINSTRCHRTRHMKKKNQRKHAIRKTKDEWSPKKKDAKRTIVAVQSNLPKPSVENVIPTTEKSDDYEDHIFTIMQVQEAPHSG
ncbi:hypothetical protein TNCT_730531 [Trichonephila clavata]|uniref:Uncharacterized protein n=1 Tax=Trichonephila clavata TaxID=2740835 RepID=A0A8X6LE68_TRICU|nr:hypothetical protein TNCT_730531 [Trichonephila clavata]